MKWAIEPTKDKFGQRDIVNGPAICEFILIDYNAIDKKIYKSLINLICSNKQIARIVLDGLSNGGYPYLLMSLCNHDLRLTEDQKKLVLMRL